MSAMRPITFDEMMDFTSDIPSNFMDHTFEMIYKWLPRSGTLVEFGTGLAKATVAMNYIAPELKIFTCDIGNRYGTHDEYLERIRKTFEDHNVTDNVTFKIGSSLEVPIIEDLDGLFVDSEHTYDVTRDEIKRWVPQVKKGGIIIFDDYGLKNTSAREEMWGCGRAIDEFIIAFPKEYELLDLGMCAVFRKLI